MGIFSSLLELQVNGQAVKDEEDDFELDDAMTGGEDADAPETPAEEAQETAEAEDTADDTEDEDNFTLEDDDDGNMDDTEADTAEDTADDAGGDDTAADDTGDDGDDNFDISREDLDAAQNDNAEGGDDGGDAEGGGEESSGNTAPDKGADKAPADPTDGIDDDEKRAAEEAIYDTLTDEQKRIRILQLKIEYKDLYETLMNTIEAVSQIPKNVDNLETIKRLNLLLVKAKTILISYIDNNFDKNTYLENYTTYLKYMAIFRTTAKVIEEINPDKK